MHARRGGGNNRGFIGGQTQMSRRFPKRGFRYGKFNIKKPYDVLNLGKLAYYIEKGDIDPTKLITMSDMFKAGVLSKCKNGVKILSRGAEKI